MRIWLWRKQHSTSSDDNGSVDERVSRALPEPDPTPETVAVSRHRTFLKAIAAAVGGAGMAQLAFGSQPAEATYTAGSPSDVVNTNLGVTGNLGVGTSNANMPSATAGVEIVATSPTVVFTSPSGGRRFNVLTTYPPMGLYIADTTYGAYRLIIDTSGNVGIGTSSPVELLDVAGNIHATGALKINGTTAIGSDGVATQTYYAP
jgi:hypothetical protein